MLEYPVAQNACLQVPLTSDVAVLSYTQPLVRGSGGVDVCNKLPHPKPKGLSKKHFVPLAVQECDVHSAVPHWVLIGL